MITEKDISKRINRTIKSPIRIGSLEDLNLDKEVFLNTFKPFFDELEDDAYLARENQVKFLKKRFIEDQNAIEEVHKLYFEKKVGIEVLKPWLEKLNTTEKEQFKTISVITRQRNISSFVIRKEGSDIHVERAYPEVFNQEVSDFRSWERVFKQAEKRMVENEQFYSLLKAVFNLVEIIHPEVSKLKVTSHFMRTITQREIKGENSPEGVHEDGAPYIVSALVVNRENIVGGETQIFEKIDHRNDLIFNEALTPGKFAFQADTGEEKTFGNDLWHYVTPIHPKNNAYRGIRDIIGFDIEI